MPIKPGRSQKDKVDLLAALLTIAYVQQPASRVAELQASLMRAWEEAQEVAQCPQ